MMDTRIDHKTLKQGLLLLLEDSEVRAKLNEVISEPAVENLDNVSTSKLQEGENNLEIEIAKLQNENEEMKDIIIKLKSLLGLKDSALREGSEAISSLNQEKSNLETNLSIVTTDLKQNKSNRTELLAKYESLQIEYNLLENKSEEQLLKIAYYRDNFEEDLRIKEIYDGLTHQTKLSTANIFTDSSIKALVTCGTQEKFIFNLWDFIKEEVVKSNNPDQERIIRMFELLFNRFKLAYPMFELQPAEAGDKFDTQSHIKHNQSVNMSGSIQSVLFQGCVNTKTGKVVKPSIVVL